MTKTVELKEKSTGFSLFPKAQASPADVTPTPTRDNSNETDLSQDASAFLGDVNCKMQEGINALSALFGTKDSEDSAKPMKCK